MHGKKKILEITPGITTDNEFWWLIGFLQGDGGLERKDGIRLISTDPEILLSAEKIVKRLFGLQSSSYIEQRRFPQRQKPKRVLAVYSRNLVDWLDGIGLRFGEEKWNVPRLTPKLFYSYLAGLFDAEGQVIRYPNGRLNKFVIHSTNGPSLRVVSNRMREFGMECVLFKRERPNKPNPHYQLEIRKRRNLELFVKSVGRHCRLQRKKRFMTEQLLPRPITKEKLSVHR
ncbi:hypothetical protein J2P12_05830 [Candidatus Bathyarchaeota archaeon]|nr:hypothetical protein [Candidatus Bathyarchaeota archaeon]